MTEQELNVSEVAAAPKKATSASRTRSIVFVALSIAVIAVSSWITVPLGPIPFTLQMFAVPFVIVILSPKEAMATICGYLLLGAVGVPVFSGMRGGIGVLAGPTGGFLWGYIFGVFAGVMLLYAVRRRFGGAPKEAIGWDVAAGIAFTLCAYTFGCIQYMAISNVGIEVAVAACVAPFAAIDVCKIVAGSICARAVNAAVRR